MSSSVPEGGEPQRSFLKTVLRVCISEYSVSDSIPASQLLTLIRGCRRAYLHPPRPAGNSEEAQGGPHPCTHLSARSCWATAMAVSGPGEWMTEGLTQLAQAEFSSHFLPATLCLGCGPRSLKSSLWGGPTPASLNYRRGPSSRFSRFSWCSALPPNHLPAALQLGK